MNKYPNMGLYADLVQCEDDLFDLINSNFLKIDSLWMLRIEGVVDELPSDSEKGDVYILEAGIYDPDYSLQIFDGFAWQEIDLKEGMWFYDKSVQDFAYYDGTEIRYFNGKYGDVTGPNASLNNSIARFDGETGKFITDSGIVIDDENNIDGVNYLNTYTSNSIYVYSDYLEATNIYSENISTTNIFTDFLLTKNISGEMTQIEIVGAGKVRLNSMFGFAALNLNGFEISNIDTSNLTGEESYFFAIENRSGDDLVFLPNGNISLGGESRLTVKDGGSAVIIYSSFSNEFLAVSGGGSGSGGSGHLDWEANSLDAPIKFVENGIEFFSYPNDENYKVNSFLKLNAAYQPEPLTITVPCVTKGNGQFAFNMKATLVKIGSAFSGVATEIKQVVISDSALADEYYALSFQIIDENGELDGTLCGAEDIILLELTREELTGSPNNEDAVNVFKRQSEILIGSI